ncbi:MAG: tetratricopeptide repeat protein [Hydrogenophaga sp.]|nr:tetratricopeptide repeat protein [Hydrogenophaga sp.]
MSVLLDALRRSEMSLAAPTASAPPDRSDAPDTLTLGPGRLPSEPSDSPVLTAPPAMPEQPGQPGPLDMGTAPAGAPSPAQAARNLLNASGPAVAHSARQRKLWLGAGAAVLLLPMAGWLGWMVWEDAQPTSTLALAPPPDVPALPAGEPLPDNAPPAAPMPPAGDAAAVAEPSPAVPLEAPRAVATPFAPAPAVAVPAKVERAPVQPARPAAPSPSAAPAAASASASAAAASTPTKPVAAPPARGAAARAPVAAPPTAQPLLVRSEANRQLQDAWTALGQGDATRALSLYRQVLTERPDDPDAALGVAVALHRQKNLPEAWVAYQRSLKLWPDNATARTGLLAILSESDAQTAESRLNEWVQARPRDAAAQAALGNLLGRQSRWAEALPWLARAQSLEPMQATYAYNLAVALDQSRRYTEAVQHYQLALQLGGAGVPVQHISSRLRELAYLGTP